MWSLKAGAGDGPLKQGSAEFFELVTLAGLAAGGRVKGEAGLLSTGGHQDPSVEALIDTLGRLLESCDDLVDYLVPEAGDLAHLPLVNDIFS